MQHIVRRAATAFVLPLALTAFARAAQSQQPPQPAQPPPPQTPPPQPAPIAPPPQPTPPAPVGVVTPYRAPLIVLAQPSEGGVVPQDRPFVVFRFAQGEPNDALDARSFTVAVDGVDRTSLFQQTASEAWGPLAAPGTTIARGSHEVHARICSSRGACATTKALITVAPPGPAAERAGDKSDHKKTQLLDALLTAVRTLFR